MKCIEYIKEYRQKRGGMIVFCYKCGTKLENDAIFCNNCGAKVKENSNNEDLEKDNIQVFKEGFTKNLIEKDETNVNQEDQTIVMDKVIVLPDYKEENNNVINTYESGQSIKQNRKKILWLIPLISLVAVAALNLGFYIYETRVTAKVENMRKQAEDLALAGKISEAATIIDKALALRPNNKTLEANKNFVKDGQSVEQHINNVEAFIKKQDYTKALNELDSARKAIANSNGAFYDVLKKNIESKKTGVTVLQIKSEMNNKNSIEELSALFAKISAYNVKEAKDTAEALKTKIGTVAYNNANEFLKKNDFSSAEAAIEDGLKYDASNKKLISFKSTITKHKEDFEKQEQNRIAQAMAAAAQEDKSNRTNAVQVVETNASVNQYGDLVVSGKVKNVATKPISSVQVYYTIYDANNKELGTDYAYVSPNYLNINDTGDFQNVQYGVPSGHHIKVTRMTWYLR
ncbi:FxLYD domain-containing protein [Clostridium sp. DJ247]|uniref:FxLYD domain-containing protein n=1 Tax=Clostridium sp. DJ247 TaxID=2726188 RepID=UPI00162AF3B7|nr:FxLYD domain-containing protein [Clostridium sp. DJ247]MBC2578819.1 zinc ribbon domain-containing protein [Clostridium sp. DJ247]